MRNFAMRLCEALPHEFVHVTALPGEIFTSLVVEDPKKSLPVCLVFLPGVKCNLPGGMCHL